MDAQWRKTIALDKVGSVQNLLMAHEAKIAVNEGAHKNSIMVLESTSNTPMNGSNYEIITPMSNCANQHCLKADESYFVISGHQEFYCPDGLPFFTEEKGQNHPEWATPIPADKNWADIPELVALAKSQYLFFGYKSSADIIHQYYITHKGKKIGNTQVSKQQIQSFLYNSDKPKIACENKAGSQTLWEDAHNHDASVAGTYVSYWDLYTQCRDRNNHIIIPYKLHIPFNDILILQAWMTIPVDALGGDFEFHWWLSLDGGVVCNVNPEVTLREYLETGKAAAPGDTDEFREFLVAENAAAGTSSHSYLYRASKNLIPFNNDCYYEHRFTQIGQEFRCATNIFQVNGGNGQWSYSYKDIKIEAFNIHIEYAQAVISGFNLKPEYQQLFRNYFFTNPYVMPAEHVEQYPFTHGPNEGGTTANNQISAHVVKQAHLLFPNLQCLTTCFPNPLQRDVQLRIFGGVYPERGVTTNSLECLHQARIDAQFDGLFQSKETFENSILLPPETRKPNRLRSLKDNTDFKLTFNFERSCSNAFFHDGPSSSHETVILTMAPIVSEGEQDIYLWGHAHNQPKGKKNNTPPILCLVSDSFWLMTGQGIIYETQKSWNDVFAHYFPNLYHQLLSMANIADPRVADAQYVGH